jgi:hypothetical protein
MVNNSVDLEPLLPRGFIVCNRSQEEDTLQWVYVFLGTSVCHTHENVAIAVLDPEVAPVDYPHVANAIYGFLVNTLWLCDVSVAPSRLGASVVSFTSALDRQSAMGFPHRMEPYWLISFPMMWVLICATCL